MSEPSKQVVDFTNKVYDDIDNDRFGFDPLLVIAIANIIMNIIKAINVIYFSTSPKFIKKSFEKQGLMMRILMRREARKAMKEYTDEERNAVMASVSNVVRGYGDSEFKDLVSSIR
tara:strand:- start:88 stop:435 length:348 start_codon:yes stop_codon:yes gene_type:complete